MPHLFYLLLIFVGIAACSTLQLPLPNYPPRPSHLILDPLIIEVPRDPARDPHVYDAHTLFEQAHAALTENRFDHAVTLYQKLLDVFPESPFVVAALYNRGLAFEGERDFVAAAQSYEKMLEHPAAHPADRLDAKLRLGLCQVQGREWSSAIASLRTVLAHQDLSPQHRLAARVFLGQALVETEQYSEAENILLQVLREMPLEHILDDPPRSSLAAVGQFYLAAISHRQFSARKLALPDEVLMRDFADKTDLFLRARERYLRILDYRDFYWTTAALNQIGAMYREFWDHLRAVPIPPELTPQESREYLHLVDNHPDLQKLLEKSLFYHEKNLALAKQKNQSTTFVEASLQAIQMLKLLLQKNER